MYNKKPTRYYSNKQEKQIAKISGGKQVANSGATAFFKGDVSTDKILIECKTTTTPKKSFAIKKEWLEKNEEEAFAMNKHYSVLAFNFEEDGDNYFIINERTFKKLLDYINTEE